MLFPLVLAHSSPDLQTPAGLTLNSTSTCTPTEICSHLVESFSFWHSAHSDIMTDGWAGNERRAISSLGVVQGPVLSARVTVPKHECEYDWPDMDIIYRPTLAQACTDTLGMLGSERTCLYRCCVSLEFALRHTHHVRREPVRRSPALCSNEALLCTYGVVPTEILDKV